MINVGTWRVTGDKYSWRGWAYVTNNNRNNNSNKNKDEREKEEIEMEDEKGEINERKETKGKTIEQEEKKV